MAVGDSTTQRCGTQPLPEGSRAGVYLEARDAADLPGLFFEALPGDGTQRSLPLTRPVQVEVDPGVRTFQLKLTTTGPPRAVAVVAPDGARRSLPTTGVTTAVGAAEATAWQFGNFVLVTVDMPGNGVIGTWNLDPGVGLRSATASLFSGLRLRLHAPRMEAGRQAVVTGTAVDAGGAPADLSVYGKVSVHATQRGPAGSGVTAVPAPARVVEKTAGRFEVQVIPGPSQPRLELQADLRLVTTGGIILAGGTASLVTYPDLPGWFPRVEPNVLDFGTVRGRRPVTGHVTLIGSALGTTRVCLDAATDVEVPERAAGTRLSYRAGCYDLAARERRTVQATVVPAASADGPGSAMTPLALTSFGTKARPSRTQKRTLEVRWVMERRPNSGRLALLEVLGILLAVLLPLLALWGVNRSLARFDSGDSRRAAVNVLVDDGGPRRADGAPLLAGDDLRPQFIPARACSLDVPGAPAVLRASAPVNPFGGPSFVAKASSGHRVVSSVPPRVLHDGLAAPVTPGLGNLWLLVVSDEELRASETSGEPAKATLVVIVRRYGRELGSSCRSPSGMNPTGPASCRCCAARRRPRPRRRRPPRRRWRRCRAQAAQSRTRSVTTIPSLRIRSGDTRRLGSAPPPCHMGTMEDSMLRPFLLIGIGGSGGKTLRVVREDLEWRLRESGWPANEPFPQAWQFLHIDVASYPDGDEPDLPPQLPVEDFLGLVNSGLNYGVLDQALMQNLSGVRQLDSLGGWRPDPHKVTVPIDKGAGQFRALGRVITLTRLDTIKTRIERAIDRITDADIRRQLQRIDFFLGPGDDRPAVGDPVVVVVSSIAGGSGAGGVLDVCDVLRSIGKSWLDESVGILFAPDVFDEIPEANRKGVRPNALATLSELMAGYWTRGYGGMTEASSTLFAARGLQSGGEQQVGPRYPNLVGSRNSDVFYGSQNEVYRGTGKAIVAWMTSERLQTEMTSYFMGNRASSAVALQDRLGLKLNGMETPFTAMGFARVSLGRDLFAEYAAERLAREGVERGLRHHLEQKSPHDDITDTALVARVADEAWLNFLAGSRLDERGPERNDVLDALRDADAVQRQIQEWAGDVTGRIAEGVPAEGLPVSAWVTRLEGALQEQGPVLAGALRAQRLEAARAWVAQIQEHFVEHTLRAVSTHGGPVTLALLRKLITEANAAVREMPDEEAGPGLRHSLARQHPGQAHRAGVRADTGPPGAAGAGRPRGGPGGLLPVRGRLAAFQCRPHARPDPVDA